MKPLVSVIIPAYNCEKTINKCLDSLVNQTLKEIEIIVINDCSTDDTLNILKSYKDKIVLINNKLNLGPAASRNKGLDIAKGKYIGFVDADDYVSKDMYKTMSSLMTKDIDLVACSRINVTKNGEKSYINHNVADDAKVFSATTNYNVDKLFKKDIIDKHHLRLPEKYRYAEDFAFNIRYKYYANKMVILKDPFYYYYSDNSQSITNNYNKNILDIIEVLKEALKFFKKEKAIDTYYEEIKKVFVGFYVRRTREFKNFRNIKLKTKYTFSFLDFLRENFPDFKPTLYSYGTKKKRKYRSSKFLMFLYILKTELIG